MNEQKNALVQQIIEIINSQVGVALEPELVEELMAEIQRDQMKTIIYQAFLSIQRAAAEGAPQEETK
ncbi:MAG: hypothetical protein E6R04_02510 [Spirochaetes bacterium]|nr:MAG: hypothetical protein E6R04_02510 [Spirochaetota bacterium]